MSENADPLPDKKEDIRHAEKPRETTHPIADIISSAVLSEYRGRDIEGSVAVSKQTVLAGIVAVNYKECTARCLSLGVGTKFVQPEILQKTANKDNLVRDCHAEILSKRGFKKWLIEGNRLSPDESLALYTSSAPCGDSTVKKWAKNSKKRPDTLPHEPLNMCARKSGQAIVCVKGEFNSGVPVKRKDGITTWPNGLSAASGTTPAVLIPVGEREFYCATCSDKIASWSVLGVQGASLELLLGTKYHFTSVVCGRKYGDATLRRALCCRLADPKKRKINVHHPTVMCTSIQLDDSTYSGGEGAEFDSSICLWWISGMSTLHTIDGTTGFCPDGTQSALSRSSISTLFSQQSDVEFGYEEAKLHNAEYQNLKNTLTSLPHFLHNYPHTPLRDKRKFQEREEEE